MIAMFLTGFTVAVIGIVLLVTAIFSEVAFGRELDGLAVIGAGLCASGGACAMVAALVNLFAVVLSGGLS